MKCIVHNAVFVVFLCLFCEVTCFLPNRFSFWLKPWDYTHQDITEIGILEAVAQFFEDNPTSGKKIIPGQLKGIQHITAQKLFDKYYDGLISERRFQSAIDAIVKSNNGVDIEHFNQAEWHFNGEAIKEANEKMTILRTRALQVLGAESPDYDKARELIGQYLHVMQMFYSNTNWPEMNGDAMYQNLGIRKLTLMAQAPLAMDTCISCGPGQKVPCAKTLITQSEILTSGYKTGQNVPKPYRDPLMYATGKCSHGGPYDPSSTLIAALGGINKDCSDPKLSPRHDLHQQAAKGAIRHTRFFFDDAVYGLRNVIGDRKFQELLLLKAGSSMVFVIDTTGSMGKDVYAVKQQTQALVKATQGTINEPYDYIVVTFNDPASLTRSYRTRNASEILTFLANLRVSGGGDCPEYAFTGIRTAATMANPGSNMYVFTDASAKDYESQIGFIVSLILEKKLRLQFLVTGSCKSRKRRNAEFVLSRRRRALTGGIDSYRALAEMSGGNVYLTSKGGINNLAGIIQESVTASALTIMKMKSPSSAGLVNISVPVDDTLQQVTIKISTKSSSVEHAIYTPDGNQVNFTDPNMNFTNLGSGVLLIKLKSPLPGEWIVARQASIGWDVEVTAQSKLDFSAQFVRKDEATGYEYEINGRPIAGTMATVLITVPGIDNSSSISKVLLLDNDGNTFYETVPTQGTGRSSSLFRAQFNLTEKEFRIGIQGTDKSGNKLLRLQPTLISPVAIKIEILPNEGEFFINETLGIPFRVTNAGNETTNVMVEIKDDRSFVLSPTVKTFSLGERKNASGNFTIRAGLTAGITTTVTLSAQPVGAAGNRFQYEIRRFTVEERIVRAVDNSTPECSITSVTGGCDVKKMDPCFCSQYTWSGTAEISDTGFGLYEITSSLARSGNFSHEKFEKGQTVENGTIKAFIKSDCCNALAYISVVDLASNTGQCVFDLAPGLVKPIQGCTTTPSVPTSIPTSTKTSTATPTKKQDNPATLSVGLIAAISVSAAVLVTLAVVVVFLIKHHRKHGP